MMIRKRMAAFLILALVTGVLAGVALCQEASGEKMVPTQPEDMVFGWTAPTTGTPAVRYEVEIRVGGMNSTNITTRQVTENRVTFAVEWLTLYEVRVRAYDATDHVGPWSKWSLAEDRDHDEPSF